MIGFQQFELKMEQIIIDITAEVSIEIMLLASNFISDIWLLMKNIGNNKLSYIILKTYNAFKCLVTTALNVFYYLLANSRPGTAQLGEIKFL